MTTNIRISLGKIWSKGTKNPWEPGYVQAMQEEARQLTALVTSGMQQIEDATPYIIYDALEPTLAKAIEYCPVKTGELRASAYLEITDYRGAPRVEMGFARGGLPEYAVVVHENVELFHKPPTRSKFLQAAIEEDAQAIPERIKDDFSQLIPGGTQ